MNGDVCIGSEFDSLDMTTFGHLQRHGRVSGEACRQHSGATLSKPRCYSLWPPVRYDRRHTRGSCVLTETDMMQTKSEAKALRASRKAQRALAAAAPEAEYSHLDRPCARTAQPSSAPSDLGAEGYASQRPTALTGLPGNRPQSGLVKVQGKPAAALPRRKTMPHM